MFPDLMEKFFFQLAVAEFGLLTVLREVAKSSEAPAEAAAGGDCLQQISRGVFSDYGLLRPRIYD